MAGGRAIRKKRRRENRSQDFESLDFWDEHSKTLARMSHIFPAEAQHDARHRRITNFREARKSERRVRLEFQIRQPESGSGINHCAVLSTGFLAVLTHIKQPAVRRLAELRDRAVQANRITQPMPEIIRQHLQAFIEGKFWRPVLGNFAPLFTLAGAEDLAFDQRAKTSFKLR